jgi:hypothetical protein
VDSLAPVPRRPEGPKIGLFCFQSRVEASMLLNRSAFLGLTFRCSRPRRNRRFRGSRCSNNSLNFTDGFIKRPLQPSRRWPKRIWQILICYSLHRRLPQMLLFPNEAFGFGRRHRPRVGTARNETAHRVRIGEHLTHILAYLGCDGLWRTVRCNDHLPAAATKPGNVSATVGMLGTPGNRSADPTASALIDPAW